MNHPHPKPPHPLLDALLEHYGFKLDKQLSVELGVHYTTFSKIRAGLVDVPDPFILLVHDETGWPIRRIKELAGLRCLPRMTPTRRMADLPSRKVSFG